MATIDDYEDGDLAEYTTSSSDVQVQQTTVYEGSWALEIGATNGNRQEAVSTSGLPAYPPTDGVEWTVRQQWDGANAGGVRFGGPDYNNCYDAWANAANNEIRIYLVNNGSLTQLASATGTIDRGEWHRWEISRNADSGDVSIELFDGSSGSSIASASANDTTHGHADLFAPWANGASATDTAWFDLAKTGEISAPVTQTGSVTPEPAVSGTGVVDVAAPATSSASVTPVPTMVYGIAAPATTVGGETPSPAVTASGTATLSAPTTGITTDTPDPSVGFIHWLLDGTLLPTATDEIATHASVAVTFRVETQKLLNVARAAKSDEGRVDVLTTDDGGYRSVDRADGGNTFALTPPATRRPLRQSGDYHVARYEEDLVSQTVDDWDVTLEFVPDANRSDTPSIGESPAADEWGFTTRHGTIATDRVDAAFLGTGADGVERFELVARLSFQQAHVFEAALARLDGVRVREVPEASNRAVDDTSGDANTVTVSSPTSNVVADGDYVVTEWSSTRLNDAYQRVEFVLAKKGT